MVAVTIIAFLIGITLSLRLRVLVLVPVTLSVLAVISVGEGLRGEAIWWIALQSFLIATSLQSGYFIGGLLQLAVAEESGALKRRTRPTS
jgi:cytochrome c biogenesis protein CcdA